MATEQASKVTQERSPRFPSDTLRQAVENIQKVFAGLGRSAAPAEAIAKALDYTGLNGTSRMTLAALSYYGLLLREGNNHKVSELALRIIRPVSEADKVAAIKQAALEPALFQQVQQEHPDCTEELLATLLLHKGFTEEGSRRAAKVFRDNVEFLAQFGSVSAQEKPASPPPAAAPAGNLETSRTVITPQVAANELPVPIGDNLIARIPFPMSEEDFELFIGTLNLWRKKLVRKSEPPAQNTQVGPSS